MGSPAAALSDGEGSEAYAEGMDRGGDRNIYFQYFDPEVPYDTDWTQFAYLVPSHFVLWFCHAMALMFFFDDALATTLPDLCGQINAGWQAHFLSNTSHKSRRIIGSAKDRRERIR
jgi:hypothetical protein